MDDYSAKLLGQVADLQTLLEKSREETETVRRCFRAAQERGDKLERSLTLLEEEHVALSRKIGETWANVTESWSTFVKFIL